MLAGMKPVILMTGHTMPELSARRGDFDQWYADLFGWRLDDLHVVDAMVNLFQVRPMLKVLSSAGVRAPYLIEHRGRRPVRRGF